MDFIKNTILCDYAQLSQAEFSPNEKVLSELLKKELKLDKFFQIL